MSTSRGARPTPRLVYLSPRSFLCILLKVTATFFLFAWQSHSSLLFLIMDHTTLVFDTLDVDLVFKVLSNTAFSPFFTGMIPVFFYFHVGTLKNDTVVGSFYYFLLVSSFCGSTISSIRAGSVFKNRNIGFIKLCSRAHRNRESIFFRSPPLDWSDQVVVITGGSSALSTMISCRDGTVLFYRRIRSRRVVSQHARCTKRYRCRLGR